MEYLIKRNNPLSQFIEVKLNLHCKQGEKVNLQLPSWRPGRYEITNYAQNIRDFSVQLDQSAVDWEKQNKDLWCFKASNKGIYTVSYKFHANQMDAGGSWSDDEQLYLNFINFIFEIKGRENESIQVSVSIPDDYKAATALPKIDRNLFQADNFQHLVDSPFLSSATLNHYSYQAEQSTFHLWFHGEIHFDIEKLLESFKGFTQKQISAFGDFPAQNYHFLYQLLPYKHYHGVEHQFSTVITFGPAESLSEKKNLEELFGVSAHELYHFWNVCRIRPKELLPYDFSKEAYIQTGVVAEGVTTYMGDIFLLKSGYFNLEEYLSKILEKLFQREFESFGWQNQSIAASSFDLWLDGYKPGIPDKKVSIYNRGALISLCLDLILLDEGSSLHEVMKDMWNNFGKKHKGYDMEDFQNIVTLHHSSPKIIDNFFKDYVTGKKDLFPVLKAQLESINIKINGEKNSDYYMSQFGIKLHTDGTISKIHPESAAFNLLMLGDKIEQVDGLAFENNPAKGVQKIHLSINRFGRPIQLVLEDKKGHYYPSFRFEVMEENNKRVKWME
ncbi:M61 family peptidase [Echinicola marina]|uniref:M61 family metallopeptidase n=1 Tax=Echinicola marina TaxID=2859768 RepID=UPI001CF6AC29|nr:M61 family peptidase [Echinicola marina]UCS95134.1 M61 family peptidase [Echinicola marina]